jgi:transposase InsO family protein
MINERTEFALRSLQPDVNMSELCKEYGISRTIGYKWKKRFLEEGAPGMRDQSRRPKQPGRELCEEVILRINRLHERHRKWGPKKIHAQYAKAYGDAPSLSSVKRVYERSGWVEKRRKARCRDGGRIHEGRTAEQPNDIWTVDFKGWWHTGDGERCEPLTIRDENTRFVLAIMHLESARTEQVRLAFDKVFRTYGLPKAIRSDNGTPFAARSAVLGLSQLSAWWVALGIDLERGRPGKPQDNGAHERMHRDMKAELQSCAKSTPQEQQAAFDVWRREFNEERPHEALGMKCPAEVYVKSPRAYQGAPSDIAYEGMTSRKVHQMGYIRMEGKNIQISRSLAGWSVGLKALDADNYEVYFCKLRLGQIELTTAAFLAGGTPREEGSRPKHRKAS